MRVDVALGGRKRRMSSQKLHFACYCRPGNVLSSPVGKPLRSDILGSGSFHHAASGMSDSVSQSTKPTAPSGERRQVTALFADMVGFTAISERLGEEGTFALIQPIYELMASAVREQGGSVKDFTGDGIMALFGVPEALEDAPLRACRAGLAIHERLAAAAPAIEAKHGVRPQMRIGVNSGPRGRHANSRRKRRHDGARRHREPRLAPANAG